MSKHTSEMTHNTPLRLLQVNVDRRKNAGDMAILTAKEKGIDVILVQEPNVFQTKKDPRWIIDNRRDVAIYCNNRNCGIVSHKTLDGYIKLYFQRSTVYNCYISPNTDLNTYKRYIDGLMEDARAERGDIVIAGDFNAKSGTWGSDLEDRRGEYLNEWLDSLNFSVLNDGIIPTFARGTQRSFIDLTICSANCQAANWQVHPEVETLSLHRYITFEVKIDTKSKKRTGKGEWKERFLDQTALKDVLQLTLRGGLSATKCVERLKAAQISCTTTRRGVRNLPGWWNESVGKIRAECTKVRRRLTRLRSRQDRVAIVDLETQYKELRRRLRKEIKQSKAARWGELRDALEGDPFGAGYKMVMDKFKNMQTPYDLEMSERWKMADQLFPSIKDRPIQGKMKCPRPTPFTIKELQQAADKLKNGKAPGPDGLMPECVKLCTKVVPMALLEVVNEVLTREEIPIAWKTAKAVFIPKGDPRETPRKYRPICLLDVVGKLLEHLIKARIDIEIKERQGIADTQYGFRSGHSTVDAIKRVVEEAGDRRKVWGVVILLDIKNAFNTARWSIIVEELERMGINAYLVNFVKEYFNERTILVGKEPRKITQGVPQGSVLGPLLWNVLYNGILKLELPTGCTTVAYADDLALVVKADEMEDVVTRGNWAIHEISKWLEKQKLALAAEKTECVILRGPRKRDGVVFNVGGVNITPSRAVKYLGVWLDDKLIFSEHVKRTCEKANRQTAALSRILPNIGGPGHGKRRILYGASCSVLLYAAPIWKEAMRLNKYRNMMLSAQRRMILRVISGYRTLSTEAAVVIAGIPPIDLLIAERCRLHEHNEVTEAVREHERVETLNLWAGRWQQHTNTGQWTKRLIPDVAKWVKCKWRRTNYFMTQFLSGHGSFAGYTHRIGKTETNECTHCAEVDNPEHAIFDCQRWAEERGQLLQQLGLNRISPEELIDLMLENEETWETCYRFVLSIIKEKEEEGRQNRG